MRSNRSPIAAPEVYLKVVTERVFHGTRSGEFYVFDENRIGDNYGGYNAEGGAFDFTYDESRAWLWAEKAKGTGKPRVIKAFIKAEKPFLCPTI